MNQIALLILVLFVVITIVVVVLLATKVIKVDPDPKSGRLRIKMANSSENFIGPAPSGSPNCPNSNLCSNQRNNLPYVDYNLSKIPDNCRCLEFMRAP